MKDALGREHLVTLALPLPLETAGALLKAICEAAEKLGYTEVSLLTDGMNQVVATPPK
ncbi:hypothetical protein Ait01nite_030340 [Actinoplanes italicus]|uniref:Uncharacterized protein n=1 Tax=Actinoplanes italicus TaxID=113567 RepID=A0A2T0KIY3_9ACTN|nr:hypothetical protein [Actinoplanes italicus]PRX23491.1 hypothetical protein CLV67_103239 [Actinoplanes italicus]GIE29989.1 hypothetical protein Ait01nite_030340 [Actinoplanes italicus]